MTIVGFALAIWTTTSAAATLMKGVTVAFGGRSRAASFARDCSRSYRRGAPPRGRARGRPARPRPAPGGLARQRDRRSDADRVAVVDAAVARARRRPAVRVRGRPVPRTRHRPSGLAPRHSRRGHGARRLARGVGSAFALYSANFGSYDKTWGTLAAVVVTLVWLWLTSAAILFGAEVNAAARQLATERGEGGAAD